MVPEREATAAVPAARRPEPQVVHPTASRLLWADVAKGVTIFLVVLNHLTLRHYAELDPAAIPPIEALWLGAVGALNPIRMPLFFLLAGFFAASALKRAWPAVRAARVLRPYYLFVVWIALHAVFFTYETTLVTTRIDSAAELAAQLLHPSSSLWFLYALSLYFAIAYALRALPPWLAVAAAAVALVAMAGAGFGATDPVVRNLPYFLFGAFLPEVVRRFAELAGGRLCLALLGAYAVLAAGSSHLGLADDAVVMLVVSSVGVALAVTVIVLATAALPSLAVLVARLGRRTLAVYVLHLPVLAVVHQLLTAAGPADLGLLLGAYPLIATAAVMLACVAVHRALLALSLGWLFDLPSVPKATLLASLDEMTQLRRRRIA